MPRTNRQPKIITVAFECVCGRIKTLRTKGDFKDARCWNLRCNAELHLQVYPSIYVMVNGVKVDFELVSEEDSDMEQY